MNKVFLHGRLTKDLELRYTPNGVANATFTLAVNRRFKKENEERQADFINCVVWQKPAENAANMIGKGCRVDIIGRWETRNYEGQDGRRVYVNECIVEEMTFIDFADRGGQNNAPNNQGNTNTSGGNQNQTGGQLDISDDDLPF